MRLNKQFRSFVLFIDKDLFLSFVLADQGPEVQYDAKKISGVECATFAKTTTTVKFGHTKIRIQ